MESSSLHARRDEIRVRRSSVVTPHVERLRRMAEKLEQLKQALYQAQMITRRNLHRALQFTSLHLAFRRRQLLHGLTEIYPISPPRQAMKAPIGAMTTGSASHPLMCYTIRGLRLPNNFNNILTSFDEEQVATALGYVCQLVCMTSKYLEIPLRYRLLYRSSRSVVCDDVTASSQFPLYFKNMEERRFEIGVILLNKDIEQLLQACIPTTSPYASYVRELTYTLENLDLLFRSQLAM